MANELPVVRLTKTVSDDRDFLFDFQVAPEIVGGGTIASAASSGGSGLSLGSPAVLGVETDGIPPSEGVSMRIYGGTAGTTYDFALKATLTTSSRVLTMRCSLAVVADY